MVIGQSNPKVRAGTWTSSSRWFLTPVLFSLLALSVTSCKVGPDYQRPAVPTPSDWRWKQAEPKDHVPKGAWWKVFNDAELDALQEKVYAENLDLKAAFARVEQARAGARVSKADFYPSLQTSPYYARYRTSGNSPSPVPFPVPSFTQGQWAIPFDLSYEFDLWGRVRRSFESSQQMAMSAEAARQNLVLMLQADLALNYFELQSTRNEIEVLQETVRLRSEALQVFQQRLAAGMASDYEVNLGQVEVSSAEASLKAAQRREAELINALAVYCGQPPSHFQPTVSTNAPVIPQVAPDLPSSILERRPDIAQAERELASRMAQIGVAKAAFYPVVRLTASGGVLSGDVKDLFEWESRTWSIGPSITLPIFQGGRNKANLEKAKAAYEEGVSLYRQKVLVAFREVEDNLAALTFLQDEAKARQKAASSAREAARIAYARYQAGTISFLDVVTAEGVRLQGALGALRVVNEQRLATVRLVKALGGGWE